MEYSLRALVGSPAVLTRAIAEFPATRIVPLNGVSMIPLVTELLDDVQRGEEGATSVPGFLMLSSALMRWVVRTSDFGAIAYVEAEYYEKVRAESASVWDKGEVSLGPLHEKTAINRVLSHLGVGGPNPFETAGLGRYKTTEEWMRDAR